MITSLLLAGAVLATAAAAADPPASRPDMKAYQEAKSKAGHDADAQVKLALWCEAHGLTVERIKHLTLATLMNPTNAAAWGLLGLVSYQGKWQRPEEVSRQAQEDPARKAILKEYLDRRVGTANKPDAEWNLRSGASSMASRLRLRLIFTRCSALTRGATQPGDG